VPVPETGSIHRLHDTSGDDLGVIEHPAANVEPADVDIAGCGRRNAGP
jgi:hypothetical protein